MTANSLLGMTVDQLMAHWPELIVSDPADIQDSNLSGYLIHPTGEFEVGMNVEGVADSVFVFKQSPLLESIIAFPASRQDILARYGEPSKCGIEKTMKYLGLQGAWDRLDFPEWSLHFQYIPGRNQLMQVTIMTRAVVTRIDQQSMN